MQSAVCPNEELLKGLLSGRISGDEAARLEAHLATCDSCVSTAAALAEDDDLAAAMQQYGRGGEPDQSVSSLIQRLKEQAADDSLQTHLDETHDRRPPGEHQKTQVLPAGETPNPDEEPTLAHARSEYAFLDPPQQPDELGRLGRYRVLEKLGQGGMGVVLKAEDPKLRRLVAIKVLSERQVDRDEGAQRFLREAQATAAIEHDNIVSIYDVGEHHGMPYYAMQLLQGESLAARMRREKKLPLDEAIRIASEIAAGLAAAHNAGLLHRDIKPANVWLEEGSGRAKVVDFGLARLTDGSESVELTMSGALVGTPRFMSPEQAQGHTIDARSDLFSLGSVLYQMLSGQPAFVGTNITATLMAVAGKPHAPLAEVSPETPPELVKVVDKLLAKEAADRYDSAEEVVTALQDAMDACESTIIMRPGPLAAPTRRLNRPLLIAAAAAVPLLLLFSLIFIWRTPKGDLRVEVNDPNIQVIIDGKELRLTDNLFNGKKKLGKHRLKLKLGNQELKLDPEEIFKVDGDDREHLLSVDLNGTRLSDNEFEITRDKETVLTIALLPAPLTADDPTVDDAPTAVPAARETPYPNPADYDYLATGTWQNLLAGKLPTHDSLTFQDGVLQIDDNSLNFSRVDGKNQIIRARVKKMTGQNAGVSVRSGRTAGGYTAWMNNPRQYGVGIKHQGKWNDIENKAFHQNHRNLPQVDDEGFVEMALAAIGEHLILYVDGREVLHCIDYRRGEGLAGLTATHVAQFKDVQGMTLEDDVSLADSKRELALSFDGVDDRVELPLKLDTTGPYTVEAWATPQEMKTSGLVVGSSRFHLKSHDFDERKWAAELVYGQNVETLSRTSHSDPARYQVGRRVHLAATLADGEVQLFVDGKPEGESFPYKEKWLDGGKSNELKTRLGGAPSAYFQGAIDEARISSIVRYTELFAPSEQFKTDKHTLALYHCDEGGGRTLYDASGNNHHGTVIGAKWTPAVKGSAVTPATDGPIDLLKLIDLDHDVKDGQWRLSAEGLRTSELASSGPKRSAMLRLPVVPEGVYEFSARFKKATNENDQNLYIWLPVGDYLCRLNIARQYAGLYGNNTRTDPAELDSPFNTAPTFPLAAGREYEIVAVVKIDGDTATIKVDFDGHQKLSYHGPVDKLKPWTGERETGHRTIHLQAVNDLHEFTRLELRMISGIARPIRGAPAIDKSATAQDLADGMLSPAEGWIDALHLVNEKVDAIRGEWTRDNEGLHCPASSAARVRLPLSINGAYELEADVSHRTGDGGPIFVLPVGKHGVCAYVACHHNGIGVVSGLSLVHGANPKANATPKTAQDTLGKRLTVRVRVEPGQPNAKITMWKNNEVYREWSLPEDSLSIADVWKLPSIDQPGIGSSKSNLLWHSVRLRMLTGEAKLLRPPVGPAASNQGTVQPLVIPTGGLGDEKALLPVGEVPETWRHDGVFAKIDGKGTLQFPRLPVDQFVLEVEMEIRNPNSQLTISHNAPRGRWRSEVEIAHGKANDGGVRIQPIRRNGGKHFTPGPFSAPLGKRFVLSIAAKGTGVAVYTDGKSRRYQTDTQPELHLTMLSASDDADLTIYRMAYRPLSAAKESEDGIHDDHDLPVSHERIVGVALNRVVGKPAGRPHCVAVSPDVKLAAVGLSEGKFEWWDLEQNERLATSDTGETQIVQRLQFDPDGRRLFVGVNTSETVTVWDTASRKQLAKLTKARSFAMSPDGSRIIGSSDQGEVGYYDGQTLKPIALPKPLQNHRCWQFAFLPNGHLAVRRSGDPAPVLAVIDLAQFKRVIAEHELPQPKAQGDFARAAALTHDGQTLALGWSTSGVYLLNLESGQGEFVAGLPQGTSSLDIAARQPYDNSILAVRHDELFCIRNAADKPLKLDTGRLACFDFSEDRRFVLTGGSSLKVWDLLYLPEVNDAAEGARPEPFTVPTGGLVDDSELAPVGEAPDNWHSDGVFAEIKGRGELTWPRHAVGQFALDLDLEVRHPESSLMIGHGAPEGRWRSEVFLAHTPASGPEIHVLPRRVLGGGRFMPGHTFAPLGRKFRLTIAANGAYQNIYINGEKRLQTHDVQPELHLTIAAASDKADATIHRAAYRKLTEQERVDLGEPADGVHTWRNGLADVLSFVDLERDTKGEGWSRRHEYGISAQAKGIALTLPVKIEGEYLLSSKVTPGKAAGTFAFILPIGERHVAAVFNADDPKANGQGYFHGLSQIDGKIALAPTKPRDFARKGKPLAAGQQYKIELAVEYPEDDQVKITVRIDTGDVVFQWQGDPKQLSPPADWPGPANSPGLLSNGPAGVHWESLELKMIREGQARWLTRSPSAAAPAATSPASGEGESRDSE